MQRKTMEKIVHHSSIAPRSPSGSTRFCFSFRKFLFGGFWQPELQNSRVYILNPSQKRDRVPKKPRGEGEGIAESFSWLETNRSFGCERGEVSSLYLFSSLRCVCAERLAKKRMNSGALFRNHVPPLSSVPWVHVRRESVNRAVYCPTWLGQLNPMSVGRYV